jgi:hypothetical protein
MIKSREKAKIIKVLGKQYSGKILKEFTRKGIVNEKGNSYQASDVRKIVNADESMKNEALEIIILQLVKTTEKKQIKNAEMRKNLTKK